MPTLSEGPRPTFSLANDFSSALLEFHRCQAVQALADAEAQTAANELNLVVLENQQALTAQVNHVFAVSLEYGMWANIALRELLDAEEALEAARNLHKLLADAPDAHSPAGQAALQCAYASCVAAGEAYDTCRLENSLAEAELEAATKYLNTITRDTSAVFHQETEPLRDASVAAANKALAARLDTDAAKERLDAFSEVMCHAGGDGTAHGSGMCDSDAGAAMAPAQTVADALDSDGAALLWDCDIALTGLAPSEGAGQVLM